MKLENRLKEVRTAAGTTQASLAKAVGVTRQTIIAIEQGKWEPSVKLALEIATRVRCDINDIFWLDSEGEIK